MYVFIYNLWMIHTLIILSVAGEWTEGDSDVIFSLTSQDLRRLYGNSTAPTDLDLLTGGLLTRSTDYVHGMPRIFREIILEQFQRLRSADRFWYENHLNDSQ